MILNEIQRNSPINLEGTFSMTLIFPPSFLPYDWLHENSGHIGGGTGWKGTFLRFPPYPFSIVKNQYLWECFQQILLWGQWWKLSKAVISFELHFLGIDIFRALSSLLLAPVSFLTLPELQTALISEGFFFSLEDHFPHPCCMSSYFRPRAFL